MTMVGLLLIAHGNIGDALLEAATGTLGDHPLPVEVLRMPRDCDPEAMVEQAHARIHAMDQGDGVLVLTDLYGSTPSNIACSLNEDEKPRVNVVSGLNLPMLIRVFNYPQLDLNALTEKAASGGREGVMTIVCEREGI